MDDTPDSPVLGTDKPEFRKALEQVINCYSMENGSNSPDFLLAQYLFDCLAAFDKAVMHREAWYGRVPSYPPSTEPPQRLPAVRSTRWLGVRSNSKQTVKLDGKTNAELVALKDKICADPENQMPAGSFWRFTAKTRKKLAEIDRAITNNLRAARLLVGE